MIERERRTYMHKGKLRYKRRLPRKVKKKLKIQLKILYEKFIITEETRLKPIYGNNWREHIIFGG